MAAKSGNTSKPKVKAPKWLKDDALAMFNQLLVDADFRWKAYHIPLLASYCAATTLAGKLFQDAMKQELMLETPTNKSKQQSPLFKMWEAAVKQQTALAAQLGLSPVSEARANLDTIEPEDDDDPHAHLRSPRGF